MASTFSYYAPKGELPCPLPTKEEILESKDLLDYSARKVIGIGAEIIVKYGLAVELIEGENLLPLQDAVFWSGDDTHASLNGPFGTQEELNSAMIEKHLFNNLPVGKAAFYERSLSKVLRKHPPVFTHGDLQRKNIMITQILEVDEKGGLKDGDDFEVVLPDWEASGWYPSYWEYSRAMLGCGNFEDDWDYWLGQILEEFLMEWAWADMMFRELWSQTEEGINICTLYRGST